MNGHKHRTDTLNSCKTVRVGKQKRHWVEYQLLDEQGEPLANLPYRAVSDATRTGCVPEFKGQTDEQGVIRLEELHPLPITLLMKADPFAVELQGRRLRGVRAEPPRPGFGEKDDLYGPQRSGFSPLEKQANEAGHDYHYLRIGQLCDGLPELDPPLADASEPPKYHFPDPRYGGFTVEYEQLDRRHVLEVCPFRAWSLLLHHQAQYSLANAYNLGLMSLLAYSEVKDAFGSVEDLFMEQCLDLSRSPKVLDGGQVWPCLVCDVRFEERYTKAIALDTSKVDPPRGDTQLFYAINASQVLVGWRGTAGLADIFTDLTFRPVESVSTASCEAIAPCRDLVPSGKVHLGFRDSFDLAYEVFADEIGEEVSQELTGRDLFICGHSLGGALGLIHAAYLKDDAPILYTFGMPRAFTFQAVQSLEDLIHFRHVNDMDPIPSIPPDAALDNYLYDIYGVPGSVLGFSWSVVQLAASRAVSLGDPFSHHGNLVAFFKTVQHVQERGSNFQAYRNKEGLGAPYHTMVSKRLPVKTKLYLVPSLGWNESERAEEGQKKFMSSLTEKDRDRYFPKNGNAKKGSMLSASDHSMVFRYQPYLHNQLLEVISPSRMQSRQSQRQEFEAQLVKHYANIHPAERDRNLAFLELQGLIGLALEVTQKMPGGVEALQRFDAVADSQAFLERIYS